MGLSWLSASAQLSGITAKLLVFGKRLKRWGGLICARRELLLPREQTSTWHITQSTTVLRAGSGRAEQRQHQEKPSNQRDEHYADDFTAIQNIWGFYRKGTRGCRAQSLHMQKRAHDFILVFGPTSEHLGYFHTQLRETHLERCSASTPPLVWISHTLPPYRNRCFYMYQRETNTARCPRGALAAFHEWRTNQWVYTHTHIHACKICSEMHSVWCQRWHKPSVAMFTLHSALLMRSVPYSGARFHFSPRSAAPSFCSRHLHRSLCTHDM